MESKQTNETQGAVAVASSELLDGSHEIPYDELVKDAWHITCALSEHAEGWPEEMPELIRRAATWKKRVDANCEVICGKWRAACVPPLSQEEERMEMLKAMDADNDPTATTHLHAKPSNDQAQAQPPTATPERNQKEQ